MMNHHKKKGFRTGQLLYYCYIYEIQNHPRNKATSHHVRQVQGQGHSQQHRRNRPDTPRGSHPQRHPRRCTDHRHDRPVGSHQRTPATGRQGAAGQLGTDEARNRERQGRQPLRLQRPPPHPRRSPPLPARKHQRQPRPLQRHQV